MSSLGLSLTIGTGLLNPSFWLWLVAGLAFIFMLSSAFSTLSSMRGWREKILKMKKSPLLRHGDYAALNPPPKTLTEKLIGVAKTMVLIGAILLAYDIGTRVNYSHEHAVWKAKSAEWQTLYAAWAQRQPKETK